MATFADPNGNGTATAWTNTWTNVDDAVRQPTAPGADVISGTTTDETAETLVFTDPTFVPGGTYTLWVYGTGGAKRAVDVAYSFNGSDPGLAHATRAELIPASGAAGWRSRELTAPANQTELNNLRVEFIANATQGGGGSSAPTVNAVYIEIVAPVTSGSIASTLPSLSGDAAGVVSVSGDAASSLPPLAQDLAGDVAVALAGDIAQALPPLSQDASAALSISGSAAAVLPGLDGAATATLLVEGAAAQVLPPLGQSLDGVTGDALAGAIAQNLPPLGQAADGSVGVQGIAASVFAPLAQAAAGALSLDAEVASALAALTQDASGTVVSAGVVGAISALLPPLGTDAAGGVAQPIAGDIASVLPGLALAASGTTFEHAAESVRTLLYRQIRLPARIGAQRGIVNTQFRDLARGRDVVVTREQLRMIVHPAIPADCDAHELWTLSGDSSLTPTT